jgi:hypothetical protein
MSVRVIRNFCATLGSPGSLLTFVQGQIITDEALAEELKSQNCPVVDLGDKDTTICPRCRSVASWTKNQKPVTISKANTGVTYNSQFHSFRVGEIILYEWFVSELKAAGVPLDHAVACECPACHFVFRREVEEN